MIHLKKLIKLELRNILKQKSFLICLIISNALVIIGILASSFLNKMIIEAGGSEDLFLGVNAFDTYMGYITGGNITLLLAIVISIYFGSEASDGTIKNIIAKGYTRTEFFTSKIISVIFVTLIFILTALILNYLMCFIMGININAFSLKHLIQIGSASLSILAETIMFSALSFIIFKTGANIVANICIPLLLPLALTLLDVLSKSKIKVSDFWIETTTTLSRDTSKIPVILIVSTCYIIVFILLSSILTKRKEIK